MKKMKISITRKNAKLRHLFKLSSCTSLLFTVLFLSSCQKEEKETNQELKTFPLSESITNNENEGLMEFAPATTNPYTTQNMLAALNELKLSDEINCDINKFNIRVTHKYIRFEPQDSIENNTLKADTTLILFDYPLDRKITKGGTYYKDPSLSENEFNFQWCSVPANKSLPINVHYTVLAELYLPEEDTELVQYYETEFDDCITKLVEYALKRTDNFDTTTYDENLTQGEDTELKRKTNNKYTPKGNIKMVDNYWNYNVNIRGVKVRAHRWFETRECLTDNNGNFNMLHQFRHPVDYSIKWERNDYEIRHKHTGQAYFNGPHQKSDWNLTISSNYSRMYAIIHRAAHRYYYEFKENLKSPPLNSQMVGRITLGAYLWNDNVNSAGDCRMWGRLTLNEIRIFQSDLDCRELFSTTIHELGHASHWNLGSHSDYNKANEKVCESWCRGVQWRLTKLEYSDYNGRGRGKPEYTNVVMDCIDDESNNFNLLAKHTNEGDSVKGYTIKQIEDALKGKRTWNEWKQSMIDKHNNATENKLDALFNLWN
jgi:hypothetical protein